MICVLRPPWLPHRLPQSQPMCTCTALKYSACPNIVQDVSATVGPVQVLLLFVWIRGEGEGGGGGADSGHQSSGKDSRRLCIAVSFFQPRRPCSTANRRGLAHSNPSPPLCDVVPPFMTESIENMCAAETPGAGACESTAVLLLH